MSVVTFDKTAVLFGPFTTCAKICGDQFKTKFDLKNVLKTFRMTPHLKSNCLHNEKNDFTSFSQ